MQNTAFLKEDDDYYNMFKWWMLPYIQDGPNAVLDLGCASGVMGRVLLEKGKAKEVVGAEIFPAAAAEAQKTYQKVYVGDVEEMDLAYENYFDYVICGDVLEHLKDPYKVLQRIFKWLKPGGKVLVCLPNVRHYHVVRNLVFRGKWDYVSAGVMDKTHLRFFTRDSCRNMIEQAGFIVCHEEMIIYGPKKGFCNNVTLGLFREFLASQMFCVGEKQK
jgi:2-polyprenyl-3-methyl-5-hydroxy-6-metoxy-1,4-benzoquinol methylase